MLQVTSVYEITPSFVLRPFQGEQFEDIKWLSFPSLNLSSARFPQAQRCNFINQVESFKRRRITRIIKDRKYSLLSTPLQEDTIFVESILSNGRELNNKYCTQKLSEYPEITFRNLTPGGELNPFNFYKYDVVTTRGNPPQQENIHGFQVISKPSDREQIFTPGQVFTDGTAKILVENYSKYICQFPLEYFKEYTGIK